jgi:tetratricopeptide (TPR) repeat protein
MTRFVRSLPGRFGRAIRRRPGTMLLGLIVLFALGAGGVYGYAVREWHRAVALVRNGRPAEAREKLNLCLRVWSNDPDVHRLAARAARQTGDYVTAESHLNTCLKLEKEATEDTQLEFLLMRAQTGEVEEVGPLLFGYVDRGHRDAELILESVALVYMYQLRYGPAYAALKRWGEVVPNSAKVHHFRGWVLERMDQPKLALDNYLRALELDPNLDRVRLRVAEMYLEDKQPLQALPHLELLLARDPNRPEAQARLGQCKFLQGQPVEARRLLEGAVDKMPTDSPVLLYLARLDIAEQQPARAEQRLRQALALDASDTEARFALVTALQLQKRDAEAAAALAEYDKQKDLLERANTLLQAEARRGSRDPQSAFDIGSLLLSIRHDRQALYWMDEALNRDPAHRPTHQALAEYFERQGDQGRAAFHRRKLLK